MIAAGSRACARRGKTAGGGTGMDASASTYQGRPRWRVVVTALLLVGIAAPAQARPQPPAHVYWVATWGSSQQRPEDYNLLPAESLHDATLRQVVRLSLGGPQLRVRVSNAFGTQPLVIDSLHVALAAAGNHGDIIPASDRIVRFGGAEAVTVPAGADWWSDPVALATPARARLAVSLHLPEAPSAQTGHPGAHATSFLIAGNLTGKAALPGATTLEHWYQLGGIEVEAPAAATIVALGDSITDGHGATTDADVRWPDFLAARLLANRATRQVAVVNQGIGGNHLLTDGLGPNALARFDRDVLGQAGVRFLVVLEGINDLGGATRDQRISPEAHATLLRRIIAANEQIVARAHAHGVTAIGATILPFIGSDYYHPGPETEADRQALNSWIRAPGHFDAVIDFDHAIVDPAHPGRMLPAYDSGDHLHPGPTGYKAMADAVPLKLFAR